MEIFIINFWFTYIHCTITLAEENENQANKQLQSFMFEQFIATQNPQLTLTKGLIEQTGVLKNIPIFISQNIKDMERNTNKIPIPNKKYIVKKHSLPSELENVGQVMSASSYPTKMSIESYLPHSSRRLRVRRLVPSQLPWSVSRWIKSFWNGGTTGVRRKFTCSISIIRISIKF